MTKEELKQYIDQNIYENVDGDISGDSLNEVLKAIVDDGGTKVEANPDGGGKPSILRRIKIDDEVYEAPIGPQGDPGAPGDNAYIHIKYAASVPTSDSDMHATPQSGDKFIGVYSGDSSTAPTSHTSYTWSKYVGDDGANGQPGDPGAPGDNAYVHIKYASSVPSSDSDMHATPQSGDKYIGVYSGDSSTAPTSHTSYTWSKYVGDDGANGRSIKYINVDKFEDLPPESSSYSNVVALVPSTTQQGVVDQYACIENAIVEGQTISGWSWVLIGTTAPIVSVQEIDMYGQIVPVYNEGKNVFGPGNYDPSQGSSSRNPGHMYSPSNSTGFGVLLFKVDFDNYDYLFNFIVNTGTVSSCIVNFYDENLPNWTGGADQTDGQFAAMSAGTGSGRGAWLGGFGRNTTGATENVKYDKVTLDTFFDSIEWATNDGLSEHTMSWFKHTCKYVRISVYAQYDPTSEYYRPAYMYEKARIDQSVVKRSVTAGIINLFVATIQLPQLFNHDVTGDSSEIDTTDTLSPWGIIWPDTYNQVGRPTPVIAMLHGSNGYVNENCLGYTSGGWITTREKYLEAGFAVMDVNGYGITSGDSPDANSNHWGNPASVETLDKAFEYLKQNYNVCDKLLIAGTSMGGILALTYAKTHSNKVAAIGLFAPNNFAFSMRYLRNGTGSQTTYTGYKEQAWGYEYNGWQAALDDNYSHLIGYIPITECRVIDDNDIVKQFDWSDYDYEHRVDTLTKQLIDYFPSIPIRVWQGSADQTVYPSFTRQFVNALRRGNANITLRMCEGVNHTTISSSPFVQNEAVSWFKRYVNS